MSTGEYGPPDGTHEVSERSIWLGSTSIPIFARLTIPVTSSIAGGLLISPPIGRESRAARLTLRKLAESLAGAGFAVLRQDHFGTGDSSGDFDDDAFISEWTNQIRRSVEFLRSMGAPSVSALGMRLGATILGRAAQLQNLELSSVVLWDPCESGRSYLRERATFDAVTQEDVQPNSTRINERSEFVYRDETKEAMRTLTLLEAEPEKIAERVLIITRSDRVTSSKFSRQFDADSIEWDLTDEQSALLEVELPFAKLPEQALRRIRDWIVELKLDETQLLAITDLTSSLVGGGPGPMSVRERVLSVGTQGLFAITSEPVGEANGPWIVMINGVNEDHVGPARLWVELSRRWSSFGLRCVRFDFVGLGESPRPGADVPTGDFDDQGLSDVFDVIRAVSPDDPSNVVLVGLCSGAYLAVRMAMQRHVRGVCTMNPQVGPAILRTADRLEESDHHFYRRLRRSVRNQPWIGKLVWQMCRVFLPTAYSPKVRKKLTDDGTEMLLIVSPQDVIPFPRIPILRSLDKRRLITSRRCRIEVIADLDHDFLNSEGRAKAVGILDDHVMNTFTS